MLFGMIEVGHDVCLTRSSGVCVVVGNGEVRLYVEVFSGDRTLGLVGVFKLVPRCGYVLGQCWW